MQRPQWITIGVALALLLLMYFGCPTQAPEMVQTAARRSLEMEATSPQALINAARPALSGLAKATLSGLEEELSIAKDQPATAQRSLLERLAAEWYKAGHPAISGYYAQQIAELEEQPETANDWAVAATTFSICVQQAKEEKERDFCTQRSIRAYQAAISIEPEEAEHQINLALTYTYNPPEDNPMKGILQLRDLEKKFPEDSRVLIALARLAIKTNQLDRATQRLLKAAALDPQMPDAFCLLAQVQSAQGQDEAASASAERCAALQKEQK